MEDVIWPRALGPSVRGLSQVRLQVTQIATLCTVPRGGCPRELLCPGDSAQGQLPQLCFAGCSLIPYDSRGVEEQQLQQLQTSANEETEIPRP